jgi:hypothetical protein
MSGKKVNLMNKEDFIEFISSVGPKELNDFIAQRGKPAKLMVPIIFFNDNQAKLIS